jgi:hypothetical protein
MANSVLLMVSSQEEVNLYREYIAIFRQKPNDGLVKTYNRNLKIGFTGKAQGLIMAALHDVFKERFNKSPFILEDKVILSFTEPIELRGDSWEYQKQP